MIFYYKFIILQHLKHEVVQSIRHNQILSQQLDSMDIKIGLLIQNRITLQVMIKIKNIYIVSANIYLKIYLKS